MATYGRNTLQIKQIGVIYNNLRPAMVLEWTVTVQCTLTDVAGLECMIPCRYWTTDSRDHPTDMKFIWCNCIRNAVLRWRSTIQHDTPQYLCQYLSYIALFPHHTTLPFLHVFQPSQVPDAVRNLQTATSYNYEARGWVWGFVCCFHAKNHGTDSETFVIMAMREEPSKTEKIIIGYN